MDARRAIIMVGIAVVSYLLIMQWDKDYSKTPSSVAEQSATSNTESLNTTADSMALPDVQSDGSDVPVIESDELMTDSTPLQAVNQLIAVETDVLRLKIDPRGGDIVYAALKAYPQALGEKNNPFVLLEQNSLRTYIAQSGLVGKNGLDKNGARPQYRVEKTEFSLADGKNELVIPMQVTVEGVKVTKLFKLQRGKYLIDVGYQIHNQSETVWQANFYGQFKRDKSEDPSQMGGMGMASYLGAAVTLPSENYKKIDFDDMEEGAFDGDYKKKVEGGWVAFLQHYFLGAWVPAENVGHTYNARKALGHYIAGYYDSPIVVAPGMQGETFTSLYLGPKDQDRLADIAEHLDLTVDYGWLWWVAQPLFWLLTLMHSLVGNWGWAIIMLTILVKLAFFPLSAASYRSMANMRRVAPKLTALREQHGDDRQKLSQEMMALYKKEKINPLGGCLPILVQMPVFIALYWVLMESVELRQAPFMFWLEDLSLKDPYFVLPLIMGASMFVQMQLNPTPPDPMQAKVMKIMPIMFTVFFLFFPAGLVLYWVVNNLLSIAQQYYITRKIEKEAAA